MTITTEELTRLVEAATLGPWAAKRAPHGPVDVFDTAGHDVVTIYGGGDRQMPNARLIAAAPDLAREVLELREDQFTIREAYKSENDKRASEDAATISALIAELSALRVDADAMAEALTLTIRADDLRNAYHQLPNDKNRIGEKRSRKSHARDAWLRAFRKAAASALTAYHAAKAK